jgi:hypothetical protein
MFVSVISKGLLYSTAEHPGLPVGGGAYVKPSRLITVVSPEYSNKSTVSTSGDRVICLGINTIFGHF